MQCPVQSGPLLWGVCAALGTTGSLISAIAVLEISGNKVEKAPVRSPARQPPLTLSLGVLQGRSSTPSTREAGARSALPRVRAAVPARRPCSARAVPASAFPSAGRSRKVSACPGFLPAPALRAHRHEDKGRPGAGISSRPGPRSLPAVPALPGYALGPALGKAQPQAPNGARASSHSRCLCKRVWSHAPLFQSQPASPSPCGHGSDPCLNPNPAPSTHRAPCPHLPRPARPAQPGEPAPPPAVQRWWISQWAVRACAQQPQPIGGPLENGHPCAPSPVPGRSARWRGKPQRPDPGCGCGPGTGRALSPSWRPDRSFLVLGTWAGGCKGVGGLGQDCGWNRGRATGEGAEQGWDCRQKGRAGPRACTAQPSRLLAGHHEPEVATAAQGRTRDVHPAACGQLLPRAGQLSSHRCDLPWGPGCCPVDAVPPLAGRYKSMPGGWGSLLSRAVTRLAGCHAVWSGS